MDPNLVLMTVLAVLVFGYMARRKNRLNDADDY